MWPSRNPSMKLVGTVLSVENGDALVRWDAEHPPHKIALSQANVVAADPDEPDCFLVRVAKERTVNPRGSR